MTFQDQRDEQFKQACEERRTARQPSQEQIRDKAYRIYLSRNGGPGDALSDWLLAEDQLRARVEDE